MPGTKLAGRGTQGQPRIGAYIAGLAILTFLMGLGIGLHLNSRVPLFLFFIGEFFATVGIVLFTQLLRRALAERRQEMNE